MPSFDGVPLDVDVTLPGTGEGPFPTIVMLHGFGGSKTNFETTSPAGPAPEEAGNGSTIYRYNNNFFARRGYAVVNYTARGFGGSCGGGPNGDHAGPCGLGYIRLADSRYEARDTQYLLGLLADEGVTRPRAIGVTGISYGGGQSMELAFLRDKIRRPDGELAPWRSPDGKKMRIAAAFPRWPWSDLVSALIPNGRYLDTEIAPKGQSLQPFGVPIASFLSGLYLTGFLSGYYCGGAPASTPCTDPGADITQNFAYIQAGQPLSSPAESALESDLPQQRRLPDPLPQGLRRDGAAADPERLDRRTLPARTGAARLRLPAQELPAGGAQPAARRPRPQPRLQQADDEPLLQRPGGALLRPLPAGRQEARPGAGLGHRLHPDLPDHDAGRRAVQGEAAGKNCTPAASSSAPPRRRNSPPPAATPASAKPSSRPSARPKPARRSRSPPSPTPPSTRAAWSTASR